jgi:L-threonylcarbamoyladenylate synthase
MIALILLIASIPVSISMAETIVIEISPERPQCEAIERAAEIIRKGGLVAFPTETVYGLGADAINERAIQKIFEAKARPADNPLIVHVASREMLDLIAEDVSEKAEALIRRFWPGPLTLVLKRKPEVAPSVSAGLQTVAARMPANTVALELIRMAGTPIAAPSANRAGRPSPTSAAHVLEDLDGRIDMILDGGQARIGIESTVVDMTTSTPIILRPGWVTEEMLAKTTGPVERAARIEELRRSPGTRYRHYSPRARLILIKRASPQSIKKIIEKHLEKRSVGFIGHSTIDITGRNFHAIILEESAAEYARSIYSAMRELDEKEAGVIVVEGISEIGEGRAVMDRLSRAASEIL